MGYESLIAIYKQQAEEAGRVYEEPTQCPNDGTTLIKNSEGVLHCRFDGWTWR